MGARYRCKGHTAGSRFRKLALVEDVTRCTVISLKATLSAVQYAGISMPGT